MVSRAFRDGRSAHSMGGRWRLFLGWPWRGLQGGRARGTHTHHELSPERAAPSRTAHPTLPLACPLCTISLFSEPPPLPHAHSNCAVSGLKTGTGQTREPQGSLLPHPTPPPLNPPVPSVTSWAWYSPSGPASSPPLPPTPFLKPLLPPGPGGLLAEPITELRCRVSSLGPAST